MDFGLYKDYLYSSGSTPYDRELNFYKEQFIDKAVRNTTYTDWNAKRNGVPQRFLIRRSDQYDRAILTTFPDEGVEIGDYIEWNDLYWLVYEARDVWSWQKTALLWLCNLNLQFQTTTPEIYSRWCVLDSGVYSTTLGGDKQIQYGDKQMNIFMPLDEQTKYIYTDKRLAVGTKYDKDGKEILDVYNVTSTDRVSKNFGVNSHLIRLYLRDASDYNPETDDIERLICDVIRDGDALPTTNKYAVITGKDKVRIGRNISFAGKFYNDDIEVDDVTPVWSIEPTLPYVQTESGITISVPKLDSYIGTEYVVTLTDENGEYETDTQTFKVEVT